MKIVEKNKSRKIFGFRSHRLFENFWNRYLLKKFIMHKIQLKFIENGGMERKENCTHSWNEKFQK